MQQERMYYSTLQGSRQNTHMQKPSKHKQSAQKQWRNSDASVTHLLHDA